MNVPWTRALGSVCLLATLASADVRVARFRTHDRDSKIAAQRIPAPFSLDMSVPAAATAELTDTTDRRRFSNRLAPGPNRWLLRGLTPGEYRLSIRGKRPLERFVTKIRVEDSVETIAIDVQRHVAAVRFGGNVTPHSGNLELIHAATGWRHRLQLSSLRAIQLELWQPGRFGVVVSVSGYPTTFFTYLDLPSIPRTEWLIELEERWVRGKVTDQATKLPVPDIVVHLVTALPDQQRVLQTTTNRRGEYAFSFVPVGEHRLRIRSSSYVPHSAALKIDYTDTERRFDISLDRGFERYLQVTNFEEEPESAIVYAEGDELPLGSTDSLGRVKFRTKNDDTRLLFVISKKQSFALLRVPPPNQETPVKLPPAKAMIEISTVADDRRAVPRPSFLIKYNGYLFPASVLTALRRFQGFDLQSNSAGKLILRGVPEGRYEFFPMFSNADYKRVMSNLAESPVTIRAVPGLNSVTLTFTRSEN